jgi:DNA ligase-1
MRTQPNIIIKQLQDTPSRLAKEDILISAVEEGLDEFFQGLNLCYDNLISFGVKQVPIKKEDNGQGLLWAVFLELVNSLQTRKLTGYAARDAIQLCMDVATKDQWNYWYRGILIKDLQAGISEVTINKVAKKKKKPEYCVPVFEVQLAQDGNKHAEYMQGSKLVSKKLDGTRGIVIVHKECNSVTIYSRNGHIFENFKHIESALLEVIDQFNMSYVLDGELVSKSFQKLMKQVRRKKNVDAGDTIFEVFDIIPLSEFKTGKSVKSLSDRLPELSLYSDVFESTKCVNIVEHKMFDLDNLCEYIDYQEFNNQCLIAGYEGVMLKDPSAVYECKRSVSWLKIKPTLETGSEEADLVVVEVEKGTGKNRKRMGNLICEGILDGKFVKVSVGSGFTDLQRKEIWESKESVIGQVVEIRADTITQNQNGTFSLRFPRFIRFRGFSRGEKI